MKILLILLFLVFSLVAQPAAEIIYRFNKGQMNYPTDIAVLQDGRICVADGVNGRVLVFKKSGKFKELRFPAMQRPLGLAADLNGGLLITDTQADVIILLNRKLKVNSIIQLLKVVDATDVLPVSGDMLWVVDNDGHRILIMDRQGNIESEVGRKGSSGPTFNYPASIAQDSKGQIFITDVLNGRVQLFSEYGSYYGQVAKWGITPGSMYRPKGVAVNENGAFVVTDSFTGVIHYYQSQSSKGALLSTREHELIRLKNPLGVAWGNDGILWVVESGSGDLLGVKLN